VSARASSRGSARKNFRSRRPRLSSRFVAAVCDRQGVCDALSPAVLNRRCRQPPTAARTSTYWMRWPCLIALANVIVLFIVSCTSLAPPPEVSPALVANARDDQADANVLATGRKLFVSRCLECHTLPSATQHSRDEWPHLVNRMSGRANLSASEQAAIVAYLRAASLTGGARP
jgi:hypothetical protein